MMKSKLTLALSIFVLIIAGCANSTTEPNTETELPPDTNIIQEEEMDEEIQEEAEADYLTYTNAEYSFAIDHPADWSVEEGESNGAFHVFFENDDNSFGILPRGEVDYGLPQFQPSIQEEMIADREVEVRRWELENNQVLILVTFATFPESWNNDSRIQFTGPDTDIFEEMIERFEFMES